MNPNNINEKMLNFDETFLDVSSAVLKKNNLEETEEEFIEKLKNGNKTFAQIYMNAVRGIFYKTIKEEEVISLFKNTLNLSEENAKSLALDTKEKIMPLIKEVVVTPEKPAETRPTSSVVGDKDMDIFPNINPTTDIPEIKTQNAVVSPTPQKKERIKKSIPTEEIKNSQPQPSRPSGPDNYREPIE